MSSWDETSKLIAALELNLIYSFASILNHGLKLYSTWFVFFIFQLWKVMYSFLKTKQTNRRKTWKCCWVASAWPLLATLTRCGIEEKCVQWILSIFHQQTKWKDPSNMSVMASIQRISVLCKVDIMVQCRHHFSIQPVAKFHCYQPWACQHVSRKHIIFVHGKSFSMQSSYFCNVLWKSKLHFT